MRNPHHAIFRPPCLTEDSCIAALQLANERYLSRQATAQREEKLISADDGVVQDECVEPSRYQVNDDDLPDVFWPREQ
jgi:hypothetical protein